MRFWKFQAGAAIVRISLVRLVGNWQEGSWYRLLDRNLHIVLIRDLDKNALASPDVGGRASLFLTCSLCGRDMCDVVRRGHYSIDNAF